MQEITSNSFFNLISQADLVVKMVMLSLVIASIFCWSLIIEKIIKLRFVKRGINNFEKDFYSKMTIEQIYKEAKNNNTLLSMIFLAAMREWKQNNITDITEDKSGNKKSSLKERINGAMNVAISKSLQNLEVGLNMMAIIGSSAPFIGLFGTVWGIMNSFQSIATMKNTNLAVVAPGIAEALLATGIGLFVAIPAVFFYNVFTARINRLYERGNNFSTELLNILSRELDR